MPLIAGIDEAGLGPTLGPLGLVRVACVADSRLGLEAAFAAAPLGVRDSKKLHRPGDLRPLEAVALGALGWLGDGRIPTTAAAFFALLGETEADRAAAPWMAGAAELTLPVAATAVRPWRLPGLAEPTLDGFLVQPAQFNAALDTGRGRGAVEWDLIGALLRRLPATMARDIAIDRLGGRRYYADPLQRLWPEQKVAIIEETPTSSRYRIGTSSDIAFLVGGEDCCPLIATASCIAKYARELHVLLLNRYWSGRYRWLAPTAGYPEDAGRWLHQLGSGTTEAYGELLVRRMARSDKDSHAGPAPRI